MRDWHPADIFAAVRKKGSNLTKIAQANDMSPATVRTALRRPCLRAEQAIIAFLKIEPQKIWPSRYDAEGRRTVTRGRSSRRNARQASRRKS